MTARSDSERQRCLLAIQGAAGRLEAASEGLSHALSDDGLRAANLEPRTAGGTTEAWCFTCQTTAIVCGTSDETWAEGEEHDWQVIPRRSDPTGDAATSDDRGASALRDYDHHIWTALKHLRDAEGIREKYAPTLDEVNRKKTGTDVAEAEATADDLWCRSCARNGGHCEPIADRYRGQGNCRWCGDFLAQQGVLPPVPLLKLRHAGRKITEKDVARHMPSPVSKAWMDDHEPSPRGLSRREMTPEQYEAMIKAPIKWRRASELEQTAIAIEQARETP